jgi:ABC-type multidrug transport system fused ATPase/permease subunit
MDGSEFFVFKSTGSAGKNVALTGNEFSEIIKYYPGKLTLIVSTITSIGAGVLPYLSILIMADSFESVLAPETMRTRMIDAMLILVGLTIINILVIPVTFGLRAYANPSFVEAMRNALFRVIIEQDIDYLDEVRTGVLLSRLSEDVIFVLDTYIEKVQICVQYVSQMVFAALISFVACWRPSLVLLAAVPIIFISYRIGELYVNKMWLEFRDRSGESAALAEEILTGFRTVKAFDRELFEVERYAHGLNAAHGVVVRTSLVHAIKNGLMYFLTFGVMARVLYWNADLLLKKWWLGIGTVVSLTSFVSSPNQSPCT